MTLTESPKPGPEAAPVRVADAGDASPAMSAGTLVAGNTSQAVAAAHAAEGDGLGMLAIGLVVIGAYLARR